MIISKRYKNKSDNRSSYANTKSRIEGINRLLTKIGSGEYILEDISCPCGISDDELIAERDRFGIPVNTVICNNCGIVRINPRMTGESYAKFYDKEFRDIATLEEHESKDNRVQDSFNSEVTAAKNISKYLLDKIVLNAIGRKNLFEMYLADVGCGSGGMVKYFTSLGCISSGCDYDSEYIKYGKSKKLDLEVGGANKLFNKAPFDIVILSHVFEHVTDSIAFIDDIQALIKVGSLVYVELPGILDISLPRYRYDLLRYLRFVHTFNYSLSTLKNIFESQGFVLLKGDEWIHAVFQYEGTDIKAMDSLPNESKKIKKYLNTIEKKRWKYIFYMLYVWLNNNPIGSFLIKISKLSGIHSIVKKASAIKHE